MVSYQRYEGDLSITLCETCRTQTLCPVNMKYLQGRKRVCVLNVVTGNLRGQVQVRPIDKLDEARTNADDQMMLVQHYSGDRVMS